MTNSIRIALLWTGCCTLMHGQQHLALDRVYTANQISNTVSVIDPSTDTFLGEIKIGKPQTGVLTPLYREESLVHGLRYHEGTKMLAVVAIGSNSVTLISTPDNQILQTIYIGRAPHEPTFTPDGTQIWTTVRGEAHLSVIDVKERKEIKKIEVSDGPGMIAFTPDGNYAYVCSSFTPMVDVIDAHTYQIVKKIEVASPFSPNIFASDNGQWIALTHKDIGKVTLIDPVKMEVIKVLTTGPLTNHASFCTTQGRLMMPVTVGGENCIKLYDVARDFELTATIPVGVLPHGLWASPDGSKLYVGLEYEDKVQPVDLETQKALTPIPIGQSPQALVYAKGAVTEATARAGLSPLPGTESTQIILLKPVSAQDAAKGQLSVRTIGAVDLIEQQFFKLKPNAAYTLVLAQSDTPSASNYPLHAFVTDANGKYAGQSTGLLKNRLAAQPEFTHVLLIDGDQKIVLVDRGLR